MKDRSNAVLGAALMALSALFLAFLVPTVEEQAFGAFAGDDMATVGPQFFPALSGSLVFFLALGLVIQGLRRRAAAGSSPFTADGLRAVGVTAGLAGAYAGLMQVAGMHLATPLCLAALFRYFGLRRWFWWTVVPVVIAAAVYVLFERLMLVPLPRGRLFE